MHGQCLVAVYRARTNAEDARRAVKDAGIPDDHITMSDGKALRPEPAAGSGGSIRDWLFGSVPEPDRRLLGTHISKGEIALSVLLDDGAAPKIAQVENILERFDPVNLEHEDENERIGIPPGAPGGSVRPQPATTTSAPLPGTRPHGAPPPPPVPGATEAVAARAPGEQPLTGNKEQVIPLPEEEIKIGKRATERVRRIKTYVVEEPVEKDIKLHDERTVVERRAATGTAPGEPVEREYEIRERHEEPVVEKSTRGSEELVIRKEHAERTEHVRDTVRKTKVDLGKERP